MISINTYTQIKPTYLYIKKHSITGLKYFGKTIQKDPIKYLGSGTHWKRHYKKHGKDHIITLWVSDLYYDTSIIEHALHFSKENDIVNSKEWANMILENGVDGGDTSETENFKRQCKTLSHKRSKCRWWNDGINDYFQPSAPNDKCKLGRLIFNNKGAQKGADIQKEKIWITNGIIEYMHQNTIPIPKSFVRGRLKRIDCIRNTTSKGRLWWNNGVIERMERNKPSSEYVRGRLKKRF